MTNSQNEDKIHPQWEFYYCIKDRSCCKNNKDCSMKVTIRDDKEFRECYYPCPLF
ncbi:hypothetical protein HNO89_000395 [Sporosarcina luteola]|nr:hypothetical protein [Sporosarcina luteola]